MKLKQLVSIHCASYLEAMGTYIVSKCSENNKGIPIIWTHESTFGALDLEKTSGWRFFSKNVYIFIKTLNIKYLLKHFSNYCQ